MRKYRSKLTAQLLLTDDWQDKINLRELSLVDRMKLLFDFRRIKAFATKIEGFMKEATRAAMPEGEDTYQGEGLLTEIAHQVRKGGYDTERMREDMGDEWMAKYEKPPTEFDVIRITEVED